MKRSYAAARAGIHGTRAFKIGIKAVERSGAAMIAAGATARGAATRCLPSCSAPVLRRGLQ